MNPKLTPSLLGLLEADASMHPNGCTHVASDVLLSLVSAARELDRVRALTVTGFDRNTGKGECVVMLDWPFGGGLTLGGSLGDAMDAAAAAQKPAQEAAASVSDPDTVLDRFTAAGTEAWKDVPDHVAWVREQRGQPLPLNPALGGSEIAWSYGPNDGGNHIEQPLGMVGDGLPEPPQVTGPQIGDGFIPEQSK